MRTWISRNRVGLAILALLLLGWVLATRTSFAGEPGGGHTPVTICHHAGPFPENWHTITVDDDSVTLNAHLAHGDTLGPCTTTATPTPTASPTPSVVTPTPTPTVPPSVEPSPTPTSTSTPRPTPVVVGSLPPSGTPPPTDTATSSTSSGVPAPFAVLAYLTIATGVALGVFDRLQRRKR